MNNSFIPSTIRLWNNLPNTVKEVNSLSKFKTLISPKKYIPKYYNVGSRRGQVLHTRLRMNCSSLKQHLYYCNLEPDPLCTCGAVESNEHFLLHCNKYNLIRNRYIHSLNFNINTTLLLFGNENLKYNENERIFLNVQNYIIKSKRFD